MILTKKMKTKISDIIQLLKVSLMIGDDIKQPKKYNIDYIKMGRGVRGALISVVMM